MYRSTILIPVVFFLNLFLVPEKINSQISWKDVTDVAGSEYKNHLPRIVLDRNQNPMIIWGSNNNVFFSKRIGNDFTIPVKLNPEGMEIAEADWMGPDISAHGDTVYVVFKEIPESDAASRIWCVRSYDGGSSFDAAVPVDDENEKFSRFPTVTTDENGNPVIAYMLFNEDFHDPQWYVTRSDDMGSSFNPATKVSGWSSDEAEVCDCCPGSIISHKQSIIMLYRDNNKNIRDAFAAFSYDGGSSFPIGINVDLSEWNIMACPASGPDGTIIGDTLYVVYMSGAEGENRVYYNKISVSNPTAEQGKWITGFSPGMVLQNFPRVASHDNLLGVVWKQVNTNGEVLPLAFNKVPGESLSQVTEIVDEDFIRNTDIAISASSVFIVWQDIASGTVRFREGLHDGTSFIQNLETPTLTIYPNPSIGPWTIEYDSFVESISLFNAQGLLIRSIKPDNSFISNSLIIENRLLNPGLYILQLKRKDGKKVSAKLVKSE